MSLFIQDVLVVLSENTGAAGKPPDCCSPKGLHFHVGDLIC